MKRIGTDHIDLYQIHGVDALTPIDETLRALEDLVRSGKIRYAGCSNLMAWQIMKALGISAARGWARFESLQAYYSIASRDLEREISSLLIEEKVGLMVWSPLSGGLLSGKFTRESAGPEGSRRTTFDFPPVNKEHAMNVVDAMRPIAQKMGISVARLALGWVLAQSFVSTVIVGAKTVEQLDDNLAAGDAKISAEDLTTLAKVSALPPFYPGWMIERQGMGRSPEWQ